MKNAKKINEFHDINRAPDNGKLVFPLSMSLLFNKQSPSNIINAVNRLLGKVEGKNIDIICIYTGGLYANSLSLSHTQRWENHTKLHDHKRALSKIIRRHSHIASNQFHFVSWDSLLIQVDDYCNEMSKLRKKYKSDTHFQKLVAIESKSRPLTNAQVDFILEETLVTKYLRTKRISLPEKLSDITSWQLLCYTGSSLLTDVYLYQTKPRKTSVEFNNYFSSQCSSALYNLDECILETYEHIQLDSYITVDNDPVDAEIA